MKNKCLKYISYLEQVLVLELDLSLGVMDVQEGQRLIVVSDQQCGVREVQDVLRRVVNCKRSHKAVVWVHRSQIKGKNFNAKYLPFSATNLPHSGLKRRTRNCEQQPHRSQ